MGLATAVAPIIPLFFVFRMALIPTLKKCLTEPSILSDPRALLRFFMATAWAGGFGDGVDEFQRPAKAALITPHAYGAVLDLGAGHGHSARYFDRTKVTRYIALEPNTLMHPLLLKAAHDAGYNESDGSFVLLSCGAEDSGEILEALGSVQVDTILSVLTLCSVPNPQATIRGLVNDVLRPGGLFLFFEHVLSHHEDVAWWQRVWAPIWEWPLDGCRLDRPTHLYVSELKTTGENGVERSVWKEQELKRKEGEPEKNLLVHLAGRFVKTG